MTKTLILPMSRETCDKIKDVIIFALWFGQIALLAYISLGAVYDWFGFAKYENHWYESGANVAILVFSMLGNIVSVSIMCMVSIGEKGYVNFKCNCESETKEEKSVD